MIVNAHKIFTLSSIIVSSTLFCNDLQQQYLRRKLCVGAAEGAAIGILLSPLLNLSNQTINNQPKSLTRGLHGSWSMCLGKIGTTALQEYTYAQAQNTMASSDLNENQRKGMAALAAGTVSSVGPNAAELWTTKAQHNYRISPLQFGSLFLRSLPAAATRELAFCGAHLLAAEKIRALLLQQRYNETQAAVTSGIACGIPAALISQPGHVIKTKIQTDPEGLRYRTTFQTGAKLIREQGIQALWKGSTIRIIAVTTAVTSILGVRSVAATHWPLPELTQK